MTFSGYLEDYIGVRFTVVTGCTIMATGVLLTSFSIQVRCYNLIDSWPISLDS